MLPHITAHTVDRVQLARWIINRNLGRIDAMMFNDAGQETDYGLDPEVYNATIEHGEAFMTSKCEGKTGRVACNRPYGNERPSKPMRNFPFLPEAEDIVMIREQLADYSVPE